MQAQSRDEEIKAIACCHRKTNKFSGSVSVSADDSRNDDVIFCGFITIYALICESA